MHVFGFIYFADPLYLVVTLVLAIPSLLAAARVKSTFAKYARVATRSGLTGAEAAMAVLRAGGVQGVRVEPHKGFLSDHYDPRAKVLRLSPEVYGGRSVSSAAVAAHEAGHALQDARGYLPLRLRSAIVPVASIGNRLWALPFFIGFLTNASGLMYVGIAMFAAVILFQLITLPTEFDASRRAEAVLAETGIIGAGAEAQGVSRVLRAAAMTYVAAAVTAILHMLYLLTVASRD